jgi:hypothetical protein
MKQTRANINQANSQHSTGPKTESGKRRSSLNALRHGLTGQIVVMPTEDLEAYRSHLKSLTDEYQPANPTEALLVQALADCSWRLNRVAAMETNLLTLGITTASPVTDAPPQVQDALSMVSALESQSKALSNLSMHSQRLSRQFEKTVTQLRELQKTRLTQERRDLDRLVDVIKMYQDKGQTYDASRDGFVFSKSQIAAAIAVRNREWLIAKAWSHRCKSAAA